MAENEARNGVFQNRYTSNIRMEEYYVNSWEWGI